jgi:DNA-binding NarL/FixJ family response regulator
MSGFIDSRKRTDPKALTPREFEVAKLLAIGLNGHEIAERLDMSVKTFDTHRGHLLKKLDLRNNVELARHALREAWVTL